MKRCLDKRNRLTRSGAAAHTLPKCKFFDVLMFLNDKISNQETQSNIDISKSSNNHESIPSPLSSSSMLSSPSGSFSTDAAADTSTNTRKRSLKNKQGMSQRIDLLTLDFLEKASNEKIPKKEDEEDSDLLFFKSLLPSMKNLSRRSNRVARKKIQDIIFELEMSEDE